METLTAPSRGILVFAGPSLPVDPAARAEMLDGVEHRPPARRGDLLQAVADGFDVIVLVDGLYYSVPAVTHKEILHALDSGVTVVGAASLGALRAAEMAGHGMVGVGPIFERYHRGEIEGDDEVAVLHLPERNDFRPVSLALVEIREALEEPSLRVTETERRRLVGPLVRRAFTERREEVVLRLAREVLGPARADRLMEWLETERPKERDARLAVEAARRLLANARRPDEPVTPDPMTRFAGVYRDAYLRPRSRDGRLPPYRRIWGLVQLLHPEAPDFVRRVRTRRLLAAAAVRAGLDDASSAAKAETTREVDVLAGRLAERAVDCPFSRRELRQEARLRRLAATAERELGGADAALAELAGALGHGRSEGLFRLLEADDTLLPGWWLARAFAFSPAFEVAARAAEAVDQIHAAFERWADGARVADRSLDRLVVEIWPDATPDGLEAAAARRGFVAHGGSQEPGWREVLRWLAPAERLPRPLNDYPAHRAALSSSPLGDASANPTTSSRERFRPEPHPPTDRFSELQGVTS